MPTKWSKDNLAHWGTYLSLTELGEIKAAFISFESAEKQPMPALEFFVLTAPPSENGRRAYMLADRIFKYIAYYYRPNWQSVDVQTYEKALDNIAKTLVDKDKTISDLGHLIDNIFKFRNE